EVAAFEEAVEKAIEFAKEDGKTLVVVGGDHDTGGMTTGANGSMELNLDVLQNVTATGDYMASQLNDDRSNVREVVEGHTRLTLSEQQVQKVQEAEDAALAINTVTSEHASVGWTSTNHTGVDIPLYVYGPQSEKFLGFHDNTDLPKKIAEMMKLK
ncbi:alkaline phosphatase, partial [Oceanobacillus caeni]